MLKTTDPLKSISGAFYTIIIRIQNKNLKVQILAHHDHT